jgi:hypothetical protein
MRGIERTSRRARPALWRLVAAWSVVVALLAVAAAPLWHDHAHDHAPPPAAAKGHVHADGTCCTHDHGTTSKGAPPPSDRHAPAPTDGDDCAICLAVHAPMGDGLPSLPLLDLPVAAGMVRLFGAERPSVEWVGRDRASRGPPLVRPVG